MRTSLVGQSYDSGSTAISVRSLRAAVLTLATLAAGCASPSAGPGPLVPLDVGTEQHVTLEWQAEPRAAGTLVRGYVRNPSPYTFDHVRVLVDALDGDGRIVAQQVVWAPGRLASWARNYFEAFMPAASAYRVRVFSYERVETDGVHRRRSW